MKTKIKSIEELENIVKNLKKQKLIGKDKMELILIKYR